MFQICLLELKYCHILDVEHYGGLAFLKVVIAGYFLWMLAIFFIANQVYVFLCILNIICACVFLYHVLVLESLG